MNTRKKRIAPRRLAVTAISCLLLAAGIGGLTRLDGQDWERAKAFWGGTPPVTMTPLAAVSPSVQPGGITATPLSSPATASPEPEILANLYSPHALLMRLSDGQVVAGAGQDERAYPASLTKMMTALVAIEHLTDFNQLIELPKALFAPLNERGASMAGFLPGETVRAIDLLYGVMLPSGAECSVGLATYLAGSEEAFVGWMNEKARQLGMTGTNFANATGLHHEDHYTTAGDMATLMREALENETFRQLITAQKHSTAATNLHPDGITVRSTLFDKATGHQAGSAQLLGGKTGFTNDAGLCLASLASIGDEEYLLITMGAPGSNATDPYHVIDAFTVYDSIG